MKYLVQRVIPNSTNFPGQNAKKSYLLTCVKSSKVISAMNGKIVVVQKTWQGAKKQQWHLVPLTDADKGHYKIVNLTSGKVMDVRGGSKTNGAEIIEWNWHGGHNQQWKVDHLGSGKFKISSRQSRLVLDVSGGSSEENAQVIQWPWHGGGNQQWMASEVSDNLFGKEYVTVYQAAKFGGKSQALYPGKYDFRQLILGNDTLSSLKVPNGFRATLYEHADFKGRKKVFTSDASWVGDDFNDKTSSIVVDLVAEVFANANFTGRRRSLGIGTYAIEQWYSIPGGLKWVDVGSDGTTWGVNEKDAIYRRDLDKWTLIPGKLKQISVGNARNVWGVNATDDIFAWTGTKWKKVDGKLKNVSVGYDGTVWGVNVHDDIFQRTGNSWTRISGKLKQISVGSSRRVWGVNAKDDIFRRSGKKWVHVPGKLKNVSIGYDGALWGVNANGDIFQRVRSNWKHIPGKLIQISVGNKDHIWGVNKTHRICVRTGNRFGLGLPNDRISSIKVPQGLMVSIYENPNLSGRTKIFLEDASFVGDDMNDITSAIRVGRIGVPIPSRVLRFGDKITLRSFHNKYLVAESSGELNANRDAAQSWETFSLERAGTTKFKNYVSFGDVIALKGAHGKYISSQPDGRAMAKGPAVKSLEQLVIYRAGKSTSPVFVSSDDLVGLVSFASKKFLVAESNGTANANRPHLREWETWTIDRPVSTADSGLCGAQFCGTDACGADACGGDVCGADACGAAVCAAAVTGAAACGAAVEGISACAAQAAGVSACGAAAAGFSVCGADVTGIAVCGADACGVAACGAAATGITACGANISGVDVCGAAAAGIDTCAAAASGISACGADVVGISACAAAVSGIDVCGARADGISACAAEASGIQVCGAALGDVCAANTCGINACPADACAVDACAIDVIPVVPGI